MKYLIIQADLDYDFLPADGLTVKKIFDTEKEARDYIVSLEEDYKNSWNEKRLYINGYVDKIKLPNEPFTNNEWATFISENGDYKNGLFSNQVTPDNFHNRLKDDLLRRDYYFKKDHPDYQPPSLRSANYNNLYVVELDESL